MKIQELVELAESISHNVDFNLPNKELWLVIGKAIDEAEIPNGCRSHLLNIIWTIAKLAKDSSDE